MKVPYPWGTSEPPARRSRRLIESLQVELFTVKVTSGQRREQARRRLQAAEAGLQVLIEHRRAAVQAALDDLADLEAVVARVVEGGNRAPAMGSPATVGPGVSVPVSSSMVRPDLAVLPVHAEAADDLQLLEEARLTWLSLLSAATPPAAEGDGREAYGSAESEDSDVSNAMGDLPLTRPQPPPVTRRSRARGAAHTSPARPKVYLPLHDFDEEPDPEAVFIDPDGVVGDGSMDAILAKYGVVIDNTA